MPKDTNIRRRPRDLGSREMTRADRVDPPRDFPGRLKLALELSGKTQTQTNRDLELPQGYMSRLVRGLRGSKALDPELIRRLADYLEVGFEWLAIGRGLMRPGSSQTPLEEAMIFARRHGCREDAIEAAAERHRDDEEMTAIDWILAFDAHARRLERLGKPRPEDIAREQKAIARLAAKRQRLLTELAELNARIEPQARPEPKKRRKTPA